MNLHAYFLRLGLQQTDQPPAPTLATLEDIVYRHTTTIPFENLNPFLGLPVSLDLADLERKLLTQGRGGYCYEQNALLAEVLSTLGFNVTGLSARVLWQQEDDAITPRTHMLLRVDLDERVHIVDVGFGALTLTGVLELIANIEQKTPHEPFRLLQRQEEWRMQGQVNGKWVNLYQFDLQRQYPGDYDAMNYFVATHPTSPFVPNLIVTRPIDAGRFSLHNRELTFYGRQGGIERRSLQSASEIRAVLESEFQIVVPRAPHLIERLSLLTS